MFGRLGDKQGCRRKSENQRPRLGHLPAPCSRRSWWRPALSHCVWGSHCTIGGSQEPLCGSSLGQSSQCGKLTRPIEICRGKWELSILLANLIISKYCYSHHLMKPRGKDGQNGEKIEMPNKEPNETVRTENCFICTSIEWFWLYIQKFQRNLKATSKKI